MSNRRSGLGKGLDALIPLGESELPASRITQLPIDRISPNPRQPRAKFDPDELADLAVSIREHGVLQPLIVTKGKQPQKYTLITGERRLLAAREAGLTYVPGILRDVSDQELIELALVENVQRADLSPLEAAEAYRQLTEDFNLSHEEIANRVGKSRAAITNTLRLFNLPPAVQKALAEGQISEGHARALLALPSPQSQSAALQTVLKRALNVRQTEELVRRLSGEKTSKPSKTQQSPEVIALQDRLRERLGTKVSLNQRAKGGTVVIHYYSSEELNSLVDLILGEET
jgi:ParB family chromosome partitioning protein